MYIRLTNLNDEKINLYYPNIGYLISTPKGIEILYSGKRVHVKETMNEIFNIALRAFEEDFELMTGDRYNPSLDY